MNDFVYKYDHLFRKYCSHHHNVIDKKMPSKRKLSFIDRMIEKLPEMHFIGYRYCGPNTNLADRLAHGERGINQLDCACMEHDIVYAESDDLVLRCVADKLLVLKALKRIFAKDSRIGERFAALIVVWLIGTKIILGKIEMYTRKCCCCLALKSRKTK